MTWRLDSGAALLLPAFEREQLTSWMRENDMHRATAQHPVTVADGTITFGQDRSTAQVRTAHRQIVTLEVPMRTEPPLVSRPSCAPAVQAAMAEHEYSVTGGGVCVDCTPHRVDPDGRTRFQIRDAVPWPCPPLRTILGDPHE